VISSGGHGGRRKSPLVFTEQIGIERQVPGEEPERELAPAPELAAA